MGQGIGASFQPLRSAVVALLIGALWPVAAAGAHPTPEDPRGGLILGCPQPRHEFERPETSTDAAAVFMLVEALTLCDGATITHGEDRDFQARLRLQERLERIDRQRAREALAAQRRARAAAQAWLAQPDHAPPR